MTTTQSNQRAYCDQPHPMADVEADDFCRRYHRPVTPKGSK